MKIIIMVIPLNFSIFNIKELRFSISNKRYENLFKFYSKIILWQRYAAWLRAYRPCIHSQW